MSSTDKNEPSRLSMASYSFGSYTFHEKIGLRYQPQHRVFSYAQSDKHGASVGEPQTYGLRTANDPTLTGVLFPPVALTAASEAPLPNAGNSSACESWLSEFPPDIALPYEYWLAPCPFDPGRWSINRPCQKLMVLFRPSSNAKTSVIEGQPMITLKMLPSGNDFATRLGVYWKLTTWPGDQNGEDVLDQTEDGEISAGSAYRRIKDFSATLLGDDEENQLVRVKLDRAVRKTDLKEIIDEWENHTEERIASWVASHMTRMGEGEEGGRDKWCWEVRKNQLIPPRTWQEEWLEEAAFGDDTQRIAETPLPMSSLSIELGM